MPSLNTQATSHDPLFVPFKLGRLTLPNRTVMAPMTRTRAGAGNVPTALNATYFAQRASAGLLLSEATQVAQLGAGGVRTPGIHTPEQVAGWTQVTRAVHEAGGRIFLQLWHAGRSSHSLLNDRRDTPVAPSAIAIAGTVYTPEGPKPYETPRALETNEIPSIIAQFALGARNAIAAGFDGVEIHGANSYLIDQFLRDGTNQRTDAWGGSLPNRARLLLEVTSAVAAAVGADRVGVRLSPWSAYNGMSDSDPATTFTYAARALAGKIAYLHVVEPVVNGPATPILPALKAAFGGPVITNGGYLGEAARRVLAQGHADLVAFGTPFLANPDLPTRLLHGAALNPADPSTFFAEGPKGYTDYPLLTAL